MQTLAFSGAFQQNDFVLVPQGSKGTALILASPSAAVTVPTMTFLRPASWVQNSTLELIAVPPPATVTAPTPTPNPTVTRWPNLHQPPMNPIPTVTLQPN